MSEPNSAASQEYAIPADSDRKQIRKIEKRVWHLVLLAILVILYLTLSLIFIQFFDFLEGSRVDIFTESSFRFSIFLSGLVLLFCAYMIIYHRRLIQLTRDLVEQRESRMRLSKDLKTLGALFDVSYSINSQHRLGDILNTITQEMLACFDADHSSIMLLDKRTRTLKTMISTGKHAESAEDALVPLGTSIAGQVVKSGEPMLLQGQVNPAEFPGFQIKDKKISSALCVPLKIGGSSMGVLNVNLLDGRRSFSDSDLQLISIFANNAAVAINNSILLKEKVKRLQIQTVAERLHSPAIIREMVKQSNGDAASRQVREKLKVSILFADIRGFSSMVNTTALEEVTDFLDNFYSEMDAAVSQNGGNTDKFIGDEVMAFFGAPNILENSAESCAKTAKEMITSFTRPKARFSEKSSFFNSLGIGIGINIGNVFVGQVGSSKRFDYTVIGQSVNLARRLCENADPGQILTTVDTVHMLNGTVATSYMATMSFKGIADATEVYCIE